MEQIRQDDGALAAEKSQDILARLIGVMVEDWKTEEINWNMIVGSLDFFVKKASLNKSLDVSQAARMIGVNRTTLIATMKKYGLNREEELGTTF